MENNENLENDDPCITDKKVSLRDHSEKHIPKLYFFIDNWQKISFGELFTFLSNNTFSRSNLDVKGEIKNIHYGDILIKYGSCVDVSNEKIPFLKPNIKLVNNDAFLQERDIIIADTAEDTTVGKAIELYNVKENKIVAGLHTIACRPKVSFYPKYLGYYINSPSFHSQLLSIMQGIKVLSISKSNILNSNIMYPNKTYQQKIANFLSLVDKRITLQRELLNKLKLY